MGPHMFASGIVGSSDVNYVSNWGFPEAEQFVLCRPRLALVSSNSILLVVEYVVASDFTVLGALIKARLRLF